jgi:hypothetical protein
MAAGVLANTDEFVAGFFKRGAVKVTLFTAEGMSLTDKEKFETWFKTFITGVKNAWRTKVLNAEVMTPVVIGEGLEGLQDTELSKEKREDIATALGIPHSLLFSNAANFATAEQDDFHFYDKTIIPEAWFIQSILNVQVFKPMGYRLEFTPESLEVMQADEKERSVSLKNLTDANMPLEVAIRTLGYELTDEDWAIIEQEKQAKEERANQFAEQVSLPPQQDDEEDNNQRSHLDKWRRKSVKRIKADKSAAVNFESEYINPALGGAIFGALESAQTVKDVDEIFNNLEWMGYP